MKKLLAVSGVALLLAGCGSSYDWDEVTTSSGSKGQPTATYVDKKTKEPISGTITWKEGDTLISEFKVKNGKVQGDWVTHNADGSVAIEAQLDEGELTGTTVVYCPGPDKKPQQKIVIDGKEKSQSQYDCATGLQTALEVEIHTPGKENHGHDLARSAWRIVDGKQVPAALASYAKDGSGKLDGVQETYYPTGQVEQRHLYKNGQLDGVSEEFVLLTDGTYRLRQTSLYKDGKRDGDTTRYFAFGNWPEKIVERRESYKDGEDLGQSISFENLDVHVNARMNDIPPANYKIHSALIGRDSYGGFKADVESLKYLLTESKVDVNERLVADEDFPIQQVAENAYDMLVGLGADPLKVSLAGNTRLMMCIKQSYRNCSDEHFSQLMALANAKTANLYGNTPLHQVCKTTRFLKERPAVVQALIGSQDVNAVNYAGQTALHYCIVQKDKTTANALIQAGADLDKADLAGVTPMQLVFLRDPRPNSQKQLSWDEERVRFVGQWLSKSKFSFETPFAGFDKSLKQLMIEAGDAPSAMLVDSLSPKS